MTFVVLPGLDVVAGPDVLETSLFGRTSLRHQLIGAELLVREHEPHTLTRRRRSGGLDMVGARFAAAAR